MSVDVRHSNELYNRKVLKLFLPHKSGEMAYEKLEKFKKKKKHGEEYTVMYLVKRTHYNVERPTQVQVPGPYLQVESFRSG